MRTLHYHLPGLRFQFCTYLPKRPRILIPHQPHPQWSLNEVVVWSALNHFCLHPIAIKVHWITSS